MLLKLERGFDKFADYIGTITAIAMVLMILNVFYDVVMRYFLNSGSIAMQEMEWHLFFCNYINWYIVYSKRRWSCKS